MTLITPSEFVKKKFMVVTKNWIINRIIIMHSEYTWQSFILLFLSANKIEIFTVVNKNENIFNK